ncbi:quinone oxidoreductase [Diaporthe eres]|uniref:Quinone oxidoreductase n=1 Tax=Diaporthe eres TaxID=83184 RepID=A0ABR1P6Q6_DIAER
MAPSSTKQWVLASRPSGAPILSGPDATFKLQTAELPALKEGQVLAKVRYFSNDTGLRHLTHYLGAFGASGMTAYAGLYFAGEAKPGQTIVISAAAGATGSMAVQIAVKLLKAARVVGIAGSDEKCAWVRDELGAHECINYNSPTFLEKLKAATPDEVDVYFDNVGGSVLDAVLTRVKKFGHVAVCGNVASYNSQDKPMELRNWFEVISMRITLRGFIMLDYMDKVPQMLEELIGAAVDGRIKLDHGETIVEARIEEQPEIWMRLFSGQNQGKLLTKLIVD